LQVKPEDIENEDRAIKKLCGGAHVHIVEVLRIGELQDSSYYFIDMELCDLSLQAYIYRDPNSSVPESIPCFIRNATPTVKALQIWNVMKHILRGVAYIHDHDEVHRDLKPQNSTLFIFFIGLMLVLYSRKDSAWKIADFGLTSQGTSRIMHTSHYARGTEGYRAPELLKDGKAEYSNKVDIWAIGCILYELVIFRKAFQSDIDVYEYYSHLDVPLDIVLDDFDKDTARLFVKCIRCMLQRTSSSRPSASSLLAEVVQYSGQHAKSNQTFHQSDTHHELKKNFVSTLQGFLI
jgi:serine/threonine protein kinase